MGKSKKVFFSLFLMSFVVLVLMGCSSNNSDWGAGDMAVEAPMAEMDLGEFEDEAADGEFYMDEMAAVEEEESIFGAMPILLPSESRRQLSYTVSFTLETTEFMSGVRILWERVGVLGGYAEYESIAGRSLRHPAQERTANFDLRIPNEELGAFLEFIEDNYNIVYYQRNLDDFTFTYERQEAHLASLREQEDRLLASLEDDEEHDVTEWDLANVQSQIRDLEESNTIIQRDVDYSDVHIRLNELIIVVPEEILPEEPPTFRERLQETLDGTLDVLLATLQVFVLVAVTVLPWLILIGVVFIIPVVYVVKRQDRKKKGKLEG